MTYQKQATQKSPYAAKNGRKPPAPNPSALLSSYEPPQCIEAETALLSCMIQWPEERLRWSSELLPADFYRLHHQGLFALLQEMTEAGDDVDAVTLLAEAKARGRLEDCGGTPYLLSLLTADIGSARRRPMPGKSGTPLPVARCQKVPPGFLKPVDWVLLLPNSPPPPSLFARHS